MRFGSFGSVFTVEDAKTAFNLFCCIYGVGTLGMPANFARAGPIYGIVALLFMAFANVYASVGISKVMLAAPRSVKTYGDIGEWAMGKPGRYLVVFAQMMVCFLGASVLLVLGGFLLQVLFPGAFNQTFWIAFMALTVFPVCLVPTLKEGAMVALVGCLGTIISDMVGVGVLVHEMKGHPSVPEPNVTWNQVLTTFGVLSLAYGAAIVIPALQRQHSDPARMPRVILVTLSIVSIFFLILGLTGYSAAGCQLSGNLLYSLAGGKTGNSPLGFTADRGAVVMAYLFMQIHITITFSILLHPFFFVAERLLLGMHQKKKQAIEEQVPEVVDTYEIVMTPVSEKCLFSHPFSANSIAESEPPDDVYEEQELAEYSGRLNTIKYMSLRTVIIVVLVGISIAVQDYFVELTDFLGATGMALSCLILPIVFYLKVFWRKLPLYERIGAIFIIVSCSVIAILIVFGLGKKLFTQEKKDPNSPVFEFCHEENQFVPFFTPSG